MEIIKSKGINGLNSSDPNVRDAFYVWHNPDNRVFSVSNFYETPGNIEKAGYEYCLLLEDKGYGMQLLTDI